MTTSLRRSIIAVCVALCMLLLSAAWLVVEQRGVAQREAERTRIALDRRIAAESRQWLLTVAALGWFAGTRTDSRLGEVVAEARAAREDASAQLAALRSDASQQVGTAVKSLDSGVQEAAGAVVAVQRELTPTLAETRALEASLRAAVDDARPGVRNTALLMVRTCA